MRAMYRIGIGLIAAITLTSCAGMNQFSEKVANTVTPEDIVTGERTLNLEQQTQEVARATKQTSQILAEAKKKGFAIDNNPAEVERLAIILKRLAVVSHRPDIPWEIHLIDSPTVNAFTIGGGKIFVYQGLFGGLIDLNDDDQLAAVVAHEMGHDAYRHVSKSLSVKEASIFSKRVRKATAATLYEASFTTLQEEQADRISLLYMALAGYNPVAAPNIWAQAGKKFGNDPGEFLYDHPLNADREKTLASLAPLAVKYYEGEGKQNNNYKNIIQHNTLIQRSKRSSGNGFADLLGGVADTYSDHLKTKNEELKRQLAMQQEAQLLRRITQLQFSVAPTTDGHQGLFGDVRNVGSKTISSLHIAVYYYNQSGKVLYTQPIDLAQLNLNPGATANWTAYMLAVPNTAHLTAGVTGGTVSQ